MKELNLQSYCLHKHGVIAIGVRWKYLYFGVNLFIFNRVENSTSLKILLSGSGLQEYDTKKFR
jgi:hypothetical protein